MNLLDLFVKISVDTSEVDKTLGDTKEKALSFGDVLKANIAGQAIVAGVKAVAGAVKNIGEAAIQSYGEYEQLVGGVETLFKSSADSKIIVTMDDEEHAARSKDRYIVAFSLFPMTEDEATAYCNALHASAIDVTFSDPYTKSDVTKTMRVTSNLDAAFALVSVDGKRRYKGGEIQLREI